MWVKRKEENDWINLDHVYRIEIRKADGLARLYFTNREMMVISPQVIYLGKEYLLASSVGSGLLAQAPWTIAALAKGQAKDLNSEDAI